MLPPRTDPRWGELVTNPSQFNLSFLGLKLFLYTVFLQAGSSPHAREVAIDEVVAFFHKNERALAADITTIFG